MGRNEWSRREIIESTPAVKIQDLAWAGLLSSEGDANFGRLRAFRFLASFVSSGSDPARLKPYTMFEDGSVWIYTFVGGRERTGSHQIVKQSLPYGGFRYFFNCNGCGRRVKALYYSDGEISCRHCLHLVYQKSRDHKGKYTLMRSSMIDGLKALYLKTHNHPVLGKRLEAQAVKGIQDYMSTGRFSKL